MVIAGSDGGAIGGGAVGGGAARKAAKAELEHREYHRDDPGLLTRVLHWIGRRIHDLLSGGGGSHALLVVLLLILAAAVIFAVRAGVPTRAQQLRGDVGFDPLATIAARDHRKIAAELAAQGRRAEALREWLRAAVATIEERGVLPSRPGRTGAATAREAGPMLPTAAAALDAATRSFDEVWFGRRDATDGDVALAQAAADGVQSARISTSFDTREFAAPR